ncbi:MAG: hypothetical protein IT372_08295 [Polyangiaceae bacterium]|nr:hypothetical protein [Polyangiaceae bacterium]
MEPESLENILAWFDTKKMDDLTLVKHLANRATRACNYVLNRLWSTNGKAHHPIRVEREEREIYDGPLERIVVNTYFWKARGKAELGSDLGSYGTVDFWIQIDPSGEFARVGIDDAKLDLPGGNAEEFLEEVRRSLAQRPPP